MGKKDTGRTAEISDHSHTFPDFSRRAGYISLDKVLLPIGSREENWLGDPRRVSASNTDNGNINIFTGGNRRRI